MITFEWYVARAKINLEVFFENRKITSDEQLRDYCESKNIQPPQNKYFSTEKEVAKSQQLNEEVVVVEEKPKVTPPPKTTRKRTTRKRTAPKDTSETNSEKEKPKTTRKRNTRTRKK